MTVYGSFTPPSTTWRPITARSIAFNIAKLPELLRQGALLRWVRSRRNGTHSRKLQWFVGHGRPEPGSAFTAAEFDTRFLCHLRRNLLRRAARRYLPRPAPAFIINIGLPFPVGHGHTVAIDDRDLEIKRAFSFKIK